MAKNSSNQENDSESPKDQSQGPTWGEGATQEVNVVRIDKLQDTITELMSSAFIRQLAGRRVWHTQSREAAMEAYPLNNSKIADFM